MRTEFPSKHGINRAWHVIDANNAVLGRVASRAAMLLMGKHKTKLGAVARHWRSRQ